MTEIKDFIARCFKENTSGYASFGDITTRIDDLSSFDIHEIE